MLRFQDVELLSAGARTRLSGSIGFDMTGDLTFSPTLAKRGTKGAPTPRELRLSGPLEAPTVVVESVTATATKPR